MLPAAPVMPTGMYLIDLLRRVDVYPYLRWFLSRIRQILAEEFLWMLLLGLYFVCIFLKMRKAASRVNGWLLSCTTIASPSDTRNAVVIVDKVEYAEAREKDPLCIRKSFSRAWVGRSMTRSKHVSLPDRYSLEMREDGLVVIRLPLRLSKRSRDSTCWIPYRPATHPLCPSSGSGRT